MILDVAHTYRGDLEIELTSPSGTKSILAEKHLNDGGNNYNNWKFMTMRNWGESSAGTWTLRVADRAAIDTGTLDSWTLTLYGTCRVGMAQVQQVTALWRAKQEVPGSGYDPDFDLDLDGDIDVVDIMIKVTQLGTSC